MSRALEHRDERRPVRTHLNALIVAITVAGLVGASWFFFADFMAAFATLMQRETVAGFVSYLLYSLAILALLGSAWFATSGESARLLSTFAWARVVREAAADLLPFSQVGAIVIGFRVVLARGVDAAAVYASFIADLTTELISQVLFTLFGIAILVAGLRVGSEPDDSLTVIAVGSGLLVALAAASASARWTLPLANRLVAIAMPGAAAVVAQTTFKLADIYRNRMRIAIAFIVNLIGWFASATGAYIALRTVGIELPFWRIISLESLIFVVRSAAFLIPGGIGVQEAGYGILGPLLGLPADAALAIALLKRLRDVGIALPVLLIWQGSQIKKIVMKF